MRAVYKPGLEIPGPTLGVLQALRITTGLRDTVLVHSDYDGILLLIFRPFCAEPQAKTSENL